ncbi:MAG: prepilin-type N-terminal cleavage/methylation domain-containing protein [Evtepia sp.]
MKHNKGFTLIELMISIAIFSILMLSVMGFLVVGSRSYTNVSSSVTIQTQAQQTMAQIQEYLIDCNGGVFWDDQSKLLAVVNFDQNRDFMIHAFQYDAEKKSLSYGENKLSKDSTEIPPPDTPDLMASHLTAFSISLPTTNGALPSLTAKMTFAFRAATQDTNQTISLRNQAITATTYEDLIQTLRAD